MAQDFFKPRYPGRRWEIVFGSYEGVQKFAVNELQRMVQRYLPYVVDVRPAGSASRFEDASPILIGMPPDHRQVAGWIEKGILDAPQRPQGYSIKVMDHPAGGGRRAAAIVGFDAAGVLYGVEDFNSRVCALGIAEEKPEDQRKAFDAMADVVITEAPAVENRGIWTWGYTIYDYRRFLDNMARLRMNMLTMWVNCPPANCRDVIEYAHSRAVRVIMGFHWGWGLGGLELTSPADRQKIKEMVLANYRENFKDLPADGIYFQTLTEHLVTQKDGETTAAGACELVNEVSRELFAEQPDLYIQFGLHATSIQDNYADFAELDDRVVIVWEDAGVIPFSYSAIAEVPAGVPSPMPATPEDTLAYAKKLATFRKCKEFAMVPKGWINLRWGDEFEHHGPFVLGERDGEFIRERLRRCRRTWDRTNEFWMLNYPHAARFYRELIACRKQKLTVTGLVEDGVFEEVIQPSVALFGEMLWNPSRDEREILRLAMGPYYRLRL